jgi:hypothetical protein
MVFGMKIMQLDAIPEYHTFDFLTINNGNMAGMPTYETGAACAV